eukprot:358829-Chlamydomonas_euryale.AAC.16
MAVGGSTRGRPSRKIVQGKGTSTGKGGWGRRAAQAGRRVTSLALLRPQAYILVHELLMRPASGIFQDGLVCQGTTRA